MLLNLHIENVAIIEKLDIDFQKGFEVITGETGAGKSIIIDSIGLLGGSKSDKTIIRTGTDHALVCGTFGNFSSLTIQKLLENGIELDSEGILIVSRELNIDGKSKIKINGVPNTLAVLKAISPHLISIHGQTDTLALYDSSTFIHILDGFSNLTSIQESYTALYDRYVTLLSELQRLTKNEANRVRNLEILKFQIEDIESMKLKPGEDEQLAELEVKVKNHEKIYKQSSFAYQILKGSDKANAVMILEKAIKSIEALYGVIPNSEKIVEELTQALSLVDDASEQVYDVYDEANENAQDLNSIEERIDKINKLKKKYGSTIEDILAFLDQCKKEYKELFNSDERILQIKDSLKVLLVELKNKAEELHQKRSSAAKVLQTKVVETLVFLDMPKVRFEVSLTNTYDDKGELHYHALGYDQVDFLISANSGEDLQSLSKIASGGELARIMLALKCVESNSESNSSIVFDEIDTGVSGKTARKIGLKMLELSKQNQIFCVTHSAQIASLGDEHYRIAKAEKDGRTQTSVTLLDEEGRITELSRILGGIQVTDAQRQAAIDMRTDRSYHE